MFTRKVPLFKLLGFEVSIDLTWLILAILVTWSLAAGLFPALYPALASATYWWMAVVGALGLFVSIIVHEFSHSLVARRFDMPIKGITLFIFGGVAEMTEEEPPSAKAEFLVAAVGPVTSIAIGVLFYAVAAGAEALQWPVGIVGVLSYLAWINVILAVFNMVPAFPLDGGRVLRAALWHWKGRYRWATRMAANAGSIFGLVLIGLAVLSVLGGNFIGGMWWFLIGLFVRNAAQMSYQQVVIRQALRDQPIERFMTPDPVTVPPDMTIGQLVENYLYQHHFSTYPVAEESGLLGSIELRDIKRVDRDEWDGVKVADVMHAISDDNSVDPRTDAAKVLQMMMQKRRTRFLVVKDGQLRGIVSQSDILRFLAVKLDLEEGEEANIRRSLAAESGKLAQDRR